MGAAIRVAPPTEGEPIVIFGREPALVAGFIKAALVAVTAFWAVMSPEQIGLINGVVAAALAVYVAYVTLQTLASLILGLLDTVIALAIGFGAHLTSEQTGAIIAVSAIALAMFNRTQVVPVPAGQGSLSLAA
jgi:hypothetical protein